MPSYKLVQGKIGLNATYMLMELLRGNLILVDLVSDTQIERFISLILKVKVNLPRDQRVKVDFFSPNYDQLRAIDTWNC